MSIFGLMVFRITTAICLSVIVALMALQDLVIIGAWQAAQPHLEQELCINVDRPEVRCNAKCVLTDALSAQHDTQGDANIPGVNDRSQFFCVLVLSSTNMTSTDLPVSKNGAQVLYNPAEYSLRVFHPPKVIG